MYSQNRTKVQSTFTSTRVIPELLKKYSCHEWKRAGIWGIAMHSALLTRCNNLKSAFTKHNKLLFTTFRWNNTSQRERMNTENRKGESLGYFSNYYQGIMIGPIVVRFPD